MSAVWDLESSWFTKPWPTGGCGAKKKNTLKIILCLQYVVVFPSHERLLRPLKVNTECNLFLFGSFPGIWVVVRITITTQTPGNYPKSNKSHLEHDGSLKTRMNTECLIESHKAMKLSVYCACVYLRGKELHITSIYIMCWCWGILQTMNLCFVRCLQVFFVMRKKDNQISYLHLWHHTMMPVWAWLGVKYIPGEILSYT